MEDTKLEVLIDQFCRFYEEFETEFGQTEFSLAGALETIFVTFGITGAGKVCTTIDDNLSTRSHAAILEGVEWSASTFWFVLTRLVRLLPLLFTIVHDYCQVDQ
jgi:hypothetical protein